MPVLCGSSTARLLTSSMTSVPTHGELRKLRCVADTSCVLESQVLTYKQATGTHFPTRIILLTDDDK